MATGAIRRIVLPLALVFAMLTHAPQSAAAQEYRLASLDWPPFSGPQLPSGGASTAVATAAFGAEGKALTVSFFPWQRAVESGLQDPAFVGYFPEYQSSSLIGLCDLSAAIGSSTLGFAERVDNRIAWTTLDDLGPRAIGVVKGYVNTEDFDGRMNAGTLRVEAVVNDFTNLRKVASGRLDLAVIDRDVMRYLLTGLPSLADVRDRLVFNTRMLEKKTLHVCFNRSPAGAQAAQQFAAGLRRIDVDHINAAALSRIMSNLSGY